MRILRLATIALTGMWCTTATAAEVTLEQLWAIVQQQQEQISELREALEATRTKLAGTETQVRVAEEQLDATADYIARVESAGSASRTSIGGYGELHYSDLDADDPDGDFQELDFHRFVLSFGHQFSDRLRFFSELEVEHTLLEDTADGDSGGEVALEQAFLEFDLNETHWLRAGLSLVPMGIINETHEPPTFYGVERNDVENIIIPATWSEAGVAAGGHYGNGLSWEFGLHSGLQMPTSGSSAFRVRSGRQNASSANADNLAYTLRLKYTGIAGLELAGGFQHQTDPSQQSGDGLDGGDLLSLHGIWRRGPLQVRALWAQWNLDGDAVELAEVDKQTGWYIEPSLRIDLAGNDVGFYTRYEDLDGARSADQFEQWEVGFNYWPTTDVVVKFDYRDRQHDLDSEAGRDFKAVDLGIGYQF